jgi:hypothetical protein
VTHKKAKLAGIIGLAKEDNRTAAKDGKEMYDVMQFQDLSE